MEKFIAGNANKIIAIDIGTAAVKIACAHLNENGEITLSKIAFYQLIGSESQGVEFIAGVIKRMLDENQVTCDTALFVLNGPQCLIRVMTFPKMNDDLIDKTIKSEIKKELSISAEDFKIDFKISREFEIKSEEGINQKKIEAVVTIIDNKLIDRYNGIAELAGLKCAGFMPAAIGLFSYAKNSSLLSDIKDNEVIMFLDFGNSQMSVNFVGVNGLRFSKEINMGGSSLTTVVKTMSSDEMLSLEASEEKKFKIGLMSQEAVDALDDSAPNANLHKVLNLSFKKLFQRIRLSTGYYFAHFRDSTLGSQIMKKIVLYGGNSEIPGIISFFDDAFEAAVIRGDSWAFFDNGECNLSTCEQYNLSFLNLCSALSEYFLPEYKINFSNERPAAAKLPGKNSGETRFNDFIASNAPGLKILSDYKFINVALAISFIYLSIFSSLIIYDFYKIFSCSSFKKEYDSGYDGLNSTEAVKARNKIFDEYELYSKKKNARNFIEFKKYRLDEALASLAAQLPENSIISSLNFINDVRPMLVLNGTAAEYGRVINFSDELKKNKNFVRVSLKRSEKKANLIEFQFDCEFDNRKADK